MKMLRKLLLLGIVVLLSGILPVLAYGGSCDRMPCCHHPKGRVITQSNVSCCSPATCVRETSGVKNPEDAKRQLKQFTLFPAVATAFIVVAPDASRTAFFAPPTPPRTSDRLAILSTLLI